MRTVLLGVIVAAACSLELAGRQAAGCNPAGHLQFVCDQAGPEDLAVVPGGQWVIATAYARDKGGIRLINVHDKTTTVLFPIATSIERFDSKTYDSCPGPIDLKEGEKFQTHGIFLKPGKGSVHTVYVVHHGSREAIEVFEFDAQAKPPTLVWIGCAVAPEPIGLNAVIALPEGGFAATNWLPRGGDAAANRAKLMAGENNGELWEWHTGTGWKMVSGSEASGANGLEISKDGKWFYIAEWGSQKFMRLSRGQTPSRRDEIPVGFRIDNLRWAPDGSLLAAGQEGNRPNGFTHVIRINPMKMQVQELFKEPYSDAFSGGTVAVQIGKEIWVGCSGNGERIARFPLTPFPHTSSQPD